jgi:prevent-host-death family protein
LSCKDFKFDVYLLFTHETAIMAVFSVMEIEMLTMTSLAAQSQFGNLIDCSLRQPVAVTRRGRPVAVVQSYEDYMDSAKTIPFTVARWISKNYPLRGAAAAESMRRHLATMSNQAERDGLTEADVMRMLNED